MREGGQEAVDPQHHEHSARHNDQIAPCAYAHMHMHRLRPAWH